MDIPGQAAQHVKQRYEREDSILLFVVEVK